MGRPFQFSGRIRSFKYAFRGVGPMLASQQNAWIHAAATFVVITVGLALRVAREEWAWLVLAMVGVWSAEALNTAFEFLCDVASPEFHPIVEKAKDVAAGAVLMAAIGAVAIGILIFQPHLMQLLG